MTPSQAREAAGLTLETASRRARIGVAYLRRVERHGGASWTLGRRLSQIYEVPIDVFIFKTTARKGGGGSEPETEASAENRQNAQIEMPCCPG